MANKQKLQRNVSKKPQGAKTQKNVNIIKHFQPNVDYYKLHRNCDFPEVNADVDIIETLNKLKKPIPPQSSLSRTRRNVIISTLKPKIPSANESKHSKGDSGGYKSNAVNKLKSNTNHTLISSSSTTREFSSLKRGQTSFTVLLKPKNKPSNVAKALKSSVTTSSTSSKENEFTKAPKLKSVKSELFSTINKKVKGAPKSRFNSTSGGDMSKTVDDLRKEIRANQLQKTESQISRNSVNSRRGRVESLRDEIKNLIKTTKDDKRKHLTELTTEIAEFRSNRNVLVYNFDLKVDDQNESLTKVPEVNSLDENTIVEVTDDVSKKETTMKSSKKFIGVPTDTLEVGEPVDPELSSTEEQDVRRAVS